ncbi:MAG: hypothetical protein LBK97_07245 [Prevotellaceae bacterium]|jgi:hypothetical protein|nr:hypothetical protein [Prevotellaceae bacterium]
MRGDINSCGFSTRAIRNGEKSGYAKGAAENMAAPLHPIDMIVNLEQALE